MSAVGWVKSGLSGGRQDLVGVAQVGVDVGRDPLRGAGKQGAGMGQYQGIVVDIDDPGVGGDPLGDLVGVVGGGQAGADVQELADLRLTGQVADGTGEEPPGGAATSKISGKTSRYWSPAARSTG
jgi:hypothetical protein